MLLPTGTNRYARFPHSIFICGAADSAAGCQGWRSHTQFNTSSFYVTTQLSLILSLYAPRYCHTASAGFGRQFAKLRALSRLRRRYGSKKESLPSFFRTPRLPHYYIVRASRPSAVGFRQYPLRYTVLITSLPSLARRRCTCTSTVRVS